MSAPSQDQVARAKSPTLEAALSLDALGYFVTPVVARAKKAYLPGWQSMLIPSAALGEYFDSDQNIGILLGPMAGGIVDIDLDHSIAVEFAPAYLPETGAKFGRASARASHWIYRVSGPVVTRRVTAPQGGQLGGATLLELRAGSKKRTCQQTVGPGSIHQGTGELIEWEPGADGVAAVVELGELLDGFTALAAACLARIGDLEHAEQPIGGPDSLAGCSHVRAESVERTHNPAPEYTCSHLNTPVRGTTYQCLESLILDCIPTGPGYRRESMFRLARGLKHNLGWSECPARDDLIRVFWLWMEQARSKVSGDTPESESLMEFLDAYTNAEIPLGLSATVDEALALIEARGLPPEALEFGGGDEGVPRLIGVCWAKQVLVGPLKFALSVSECARVLYPQEINDLSPDDPAFKALRSRAHRIRLTFERHGLLHCVNRGSKGHGGSGASRFRYIGRSTPYPLEISDAQEVA